jgi:hypothetical protein
VLLLQRRPFDNRGIRKREGMDPTDKAARVAGAVYLSMAVTAPFSLIYVPRTLIVRADATALLSEIPRNPDPPAITMRPDACVLFTRSSLSFAETIRLRLRLRLDRRL